MKLGIIGGGTVGHATLRAFVEHVDEVRVWDRLPVRATHGLYPTLQCDLVLVCLPEDQVEGFLAGVNPAPINFAIRSTVPVGTTRRLQERFPVFSLVHWPEFLTGRCSVTDAHCPARNVIGLTPDCLIHPGTWRPANKCGGVLADLLECRFPGVPLICMKSNESELVKLATNGFFAVKLAFFNELRQASDALNLGWGRVLAGVLSDGRIAHSHTRVPGPDGERGFGGQCLPKDLDMLVKAIRAAGCRAFVTHAARESNDEVRREE